MKDKIKDNSDDRDGNNRQHRREEKIINVGSLLHDNARLQTGTCKRITRRIQVQNFRTFSIQYRSSNR